MNKYDEQLNRMLNLMEDKKAPTNKKSSSIEYHANGANGKVYGIIKEGTKYYIKETESGKENLSESYEYIGGFNNRRENEFKSYNDATKHLELKLMSLNEAAGKHEDVSTVDFKRGEKTFANLTEAARQELNRMQQIFENSCNIGKGCACHEDSESKGKATPEQTEKNNEPFEKKVTAEMDFKGKEGTVKGATENKEVASGVEKDLQSDKMKTANSGSEKDYKDAHDDLDGEGVADKKPAGGKVVKVNETLDIDGFDDDEVEPMDGELSDADFDGFNEEPELGDEAGMEPEIGAEDAMAPELGAEPAVPEDNTLVGTGEMDETDDLDMMLEELEANLSNATKSTITGPEKTLDGPKPEGTNGIDGETSPEWKRIEESEDGNVNEPTKQGNEETMKSYQAKGDLPQQSWRHMGKEDTLKESIARIVENVYQKLNVKPVVKESLEDKISRMVKEELTKLDAWGKHPKFRKEPMTLPQNKEVMAGTADRDFNDDSAKGEQPYGQKIGNGTPFEKTVEMLTDQVLANIKESIKKANKK